MLGIASKLSKLLDELSFSTVLSTKRKREGGREGELSSVFKILVYLVTTFSANIHSPSRKRKKKQLHSFAPLLHF